MASESMSYSEWRYMALKEIYDFVEETYLLRCIDILCYIRPKYRELEFVKDFDDEKIRESLRDAIVNSASEVNQMNYPTKESIRAWLERLSSSVK